MNQHLEFIPHDPLGKNVYALFQSAKWREDLAPEYRVQMICVGSTDYYIMEPTTLKQPVWDHTLGKFTQVVIPLFFYVTHNEIYAKCINPKIQPHSSLPNRFSIFFPSDLTYHSSCLISINTKEFGLNYLNMRMNDGSWYSEGCNHEIIGEFLNFRTPTWS